MQTILFTNTNFTTYIYIIIPIDILQKKFFQKFYFLYFNYIISYFLKLKFFILKIIL